MSRFILYRVAEIHSVNITLNPKPFNFKNGQGGHVNMSSLKMRNSAIKGI